MTIPLFLILEETALQQYIYGDDGKRLDQTYLTMAYENERSYVKQKVNSKLHFNSFYSILETMDSSNQCSLLPDVYEECIHMFHGFMTYGMLNTFGFMLSATEKQIRAFEKTHISNTSSIALMNNSVFIKICEIKVCYLNSLLLNNLKNFTNEAT